MDYRKAVVFCVDCHGVLQYHEKIELIVLVAKWQILGGESETMGF